MFVILLFMVYVLFAVEARKVTGKSFGKLPTPLTLDSFSLNPPMIRYIRQDTSVNAMHDTEVPYS